MLRRLFVVFVVVFGVVFVNDDVFFSESQSVETKSQFVVKLLRRPVIKTRINGVVVVVVVVVAIVVVVIVAVTVVAVVVVAALAPAFHDISL